MRLDTTETLLWSILRRFEAQAIGAYQRHAPALVSQEKLALLDLLLIGTCDVADPLPHSELATPMDDLLAAADGCDGEAALLVVQGLILERVREISYRLIAASAGAGPETRAMAELGAMASAAVLAAAPARLAARRCSLFSVFTEASDEVLRRLDAVGEGVDRVFGERFALRFTDIVADLVAELIPTAEGLGLDRRKVVCHLAGALMGV